MDELKEKAGLIESPEYLSIKKFEIEMILELANSDIDPLELKGMLKLIRKRDKWKQEYESEIKKYDK